MRVRAFFQAQTFAVHIQLRFVVSQRVDRALLSLGGMSAADIAIDLCNTDLAKVSKTSTNLVEVIECCIKRLTAVGEIYTLKINPRFIVPAKSNRNFLGLIPNLAHEIGDGCVGRHGTGFSYHEAEKNALCAEIASGDTSVIQNYEKLVEMSDGMLAPITHMQPKFESSGGTHLTAFVNAANCSCKTPIDSLRNADGCIDVVRISNQSPNFAEARVEGWTWTVVTANAVRKMPTLMVLAQEARNTPQQVATKESTVQVMRKINDAAAVREQAHDADNTLPPLDWSTLGMIALRSRPPCSEHMDVCVKFTRLFGGGKQSTMLRELHEFIQACGYGGRELSGCFLSKLTDLHIGGGPEQCIRFRYAIWKWMISQHNKIVNGQCTAAKDTDLQKFVTDAAKINVTAAEKIMWQLREDIVPKLACTNVVFTQLLGVAECRMVGFIWGRKGGESLTFTSLADIADVCVNDANRSGRTSVVSPWLAEAAASRSLAAGSAPKAKRTTAPVPSARIVERDSSGNLAVPSSSLESAGVRVGCKLICKRDDTRWSLMSFGSLEDGVEIGSRDSNGDIVESPEFTVAVPYLDFQKDYRVDASVSAEPIENWRALNPAEHISAKIAIIKGNVVEAMSLIWQQLSADNAYDSIQPMTDPKQVRVIKYIPAGKLKLTLFTPNLSVIDKEDVKAMSIPSWDFGPLVEAPKCKHFVATSFLDTKDNTFINPWWMVTVVHDDRKANMFVQHKRAGDLAREIPTDVGKNLTTPIMVNTSPLQAGAVLAVFIPPAVTKNEMVHGAKGGGRSGKGSSNGDGKSGRANGRGSRGSAESNVGVGAAAKRPRTE